jgi:hypothetical protein
MAVSANAASAPQDATSDEQPEGRRPPSIHGKLCPL